VSTDERKRFQVVGVGLALIGILLLTGAAWYTWEALTFWRTTERTDGQVVELVAVGQSTIGRGADATIVQIYRPVIRFTDASGREIQFRSQVAESDPPAVGATVAVRYPRDDPYAARVAGLGPLMGGAAILAILGSVMFGAGWLALRRSRALA